ncbi:hypothetical protein [Pseudonocardia alni]|uniref:hypothetical protein n=1 Tax=Pseudonocardia alni TaxID=33907 RepID=UPI00280C3793|nr:hypothetical protein [Pseudonocardia alni]
MLVGAGAVMLLILFVVLATTSRSADTDGPASDLGSGSPTDPLREGIGWPAAPVRDYPETFPGLGAAPDPSASLDGRAVFLSMLVAQAQAPVTDFVSWRYRDPRQLAEEFPAGDLRRTAIDYRSRRFFTEKVEVDAAGRQRGIIFGRCIDGADYTYGFFTKDWRPAVTRGTGIDLCASRFKPNQILANSGSGDGISPGGLTRDQARAFVSYLDGIPGLITASKPRLVEGTDGRRYLQLDVRLVPQPQVSPGSHTEDVVPLNRRIGTGFLQAAFAQTGLDWRTYPFSIDLGATEGRTMRYYLEPSTLLPAFAVMVNATPLTEQGTPTGDEWFVATTDLFEYRFPSHLEAIRPDSPPVLPYRPWPFERPTLN